MQVGRCRSVNAGEKEYSWLTCVVTGRIVLAVPSK